MSRGEKVNVYGLIAEFDPLHNGHKRLIDALKNKDAAIVAVLSGPFTQRGRPSFFDKWRKTTLALQNGVDLIIELPQCYATTSAEVFAYGAINTLQATGVVNALGFGSETGDVKLLQKMAFYSAYHANYQVRLRKKILDKQPYYLAHQEVMMDVFQWDLRQSPNDRLALAYLKYAPHDWQFFALKRNHMHWSTCSSSAIRELLQKENYPSIQALVPNATWQLIQEMQKNGSLWPDMNVFLPTLKIQALQPFPHTSDGWMNKLRSSILKANTWDEICTCASTRHHTRSHCARALLKLLLPKPICANNVPYLRILGFNQKGKQLLKQIKQQAQVPILTNLGRQQKTLNLNQKQLLDFDIARNELANLARKPLSHVYYQDYYRKPIILAD